MRLVDLRPALALCFIVTFAVPATAVVSFSTMEEEDALMGAENPQAVTIADVNGDNIGDVIAVEPDDDLVTIFVNDGTGALDLPGDSYDTIGVAPVAVATGLFNADNLIDIVTANTDEATVSVLLNDADEPGVFDADDPRRAQVGVNPIGIAVGDFNNDTRVDLAVLSPNLIYLLQGNGDGTFSAFNPATISTSSSTSFSIKTGLLDADNNLDLVVTNGDSGQAVVFLGAGDGRFTSNGFLNVGSDLTALVIADADGNRTNDLIFVDADALVLDEVRLLLNDGDATFESPESVTGPLAPLAMAALDVEPDGKVDLAVTTVDDDQIFLLCQLSQKCTQVQGGTVEAGIWRSAVGGTIPGCTEGGQVAIASGKLNDDSMDDLVALKGDLSTLCVMLNTSRDGNVETPTPGGTVATPTPTGPTPTPTATRPPTNTPTPTEVPTIGLGVCSTTDALAGVNLGSPVSVATGDFNRNGTLDTAAADSTGDRIVILLTTVGTSTAIPCNALQLNLGVSVPVTGPRVVVTADLDSDGIIDLAVIGEQGLSVFYGNGTGGFVASTANPMAAGMNPSDIAVTDLNGDSKPDLVISDAGSESVSIFLGTRERGQPFTGRCDMPVGRRTNAVISTDLNVDGKDDFAVAGPLTRDVGVFLQIVNAPLTCGSMAGSFQGQTPLSLPSQPVGLVAEVFSRTDNVPDLVVAMTQANANGTVLLFEGRAAGTGVTYQPGTATAVPTPKTTDAQPAVPSAIGTGDIERDGRPDLVLTDMNNDTLAEFRGLSSGGLGVPLDTLSLRPDSEPTVPLEPIDLTVADIDGDGRDDVVVANPANGSVSYLISGLRAATPIPVDTPIPTPTTPAPTEVGTATLSPTITPTPTRARRTPTPVPTNTQRGAVTLSGNGCSIDAGSNDAGTMLLAAFGLLALTLRRQASAGLRG